MFEKRNTCGTAQVFTSLSLEIFPLSWKAKIFLKSLMMFENNFFLNFFIFLGQSKGRFFFWVKKYLGCHKILHHGLNRRKNNHKNTWPIVSFKPEQNTFSLGKRNKKHTYSANWHSFLCRNPTRAREAMASCVLLRRERDEPPFTHPTHESSTPQKCTKKKMNKFAMAHYARWGCVCVCVNASVKFYHFWSKWYPAGCCDPTLPPSPSLFSTFEKLWKFNKWQLGRGAVNYFQKP